MSITNTVAQALRDDVVRTAAGSTDGEGQIYDPDLPDDEHEFLTANHEELLDTDLLSTLEQGQSLLTATDDDLRNHRIACYGIVVGTGDRRTIYVRRGNPIQLASKTLLARVAGDSLDRLTTPLFAYDQRIDLIVTPTTVYVLSKRDFEMLFKDSETVLAKAETWIDELSEHLPLSTDSKGYLAQALRSNSLLRRKVHSVLRRRYVATLAPQTIEAKMRDHGLDPSVLMPDGDIVFTRETTPDLLRLLNEDLFAGDFSGDQYAAGTKSRMRAR
ncbi:Kiwa anti-phage protein KwaB-like domain-containing protein [Nocardia brasiliensis]|uniref:Kiwa anti-phage protein KwaB-like domain-containing protein n=1 Tax=Nocardia brasiliensis TaxID=37326 RepID=UPI0024576099|nr:Kiwa anti-phage protein KwaB-like domain-containing protein [Nocardia brasiliensis]